MSEQTPTPIAPVRELTIVVPLPSFADDVTPDGLTQLRRTVEQAAYLIVALSLTGMGDYELFTRLHGANPE